jgi:hypothetical protein
MVHAILKHANANPKMIKKPLLLFWTLNKPGLRKNKKGKAHKTTKKSRQKASMIAGRW